MVENTDIQNQDEMSELIRLRQAIIHDAESEFPDSLTRQVEWLAHKLAVERRNKGRLHDRIRMGIQAEAD